MRVIKPEYRTIARFATTLVQAHEMAKVTEGDIMAAKRESSKEGHISANYPSASRAGSGAGFSLCFPSKVTISWFTSFRHLGVFVVHGKPKVPCYFIFGDSLVDSGNNNQLVTEVKANYPPYGIDFKDGVTGRFTNGRTLADFIGELLGFDEYIPTYVTVTDQQMSKGVNYASGGAGIREETSSHLGDRICLKKQLINHHTIVSRMFHLQQNRTLTKQHLSKCIYLVNIGSNDYINNYLKQTFYTTSRMYTTDQYARILVREYSQQLKRMYGLGGRKIVIFGLGQIGCTPAEISIFGNGDPCVESINEAVKQFNNNLKVLVDELNSNNLDAKFTFINLTSIASQQQGMGRFMYVPCCILRDDAQCARSTVYCPVRELSMTYDGFHPTEVVNNLTARASYISISSTDVSPYDISHLVDL
ncbi:GDSL esterase/lipase At2g19050-like [Rutidosis leptorrhynchoides]|uniref:GDSL esterase/lipase At2g19050-like n=1 Tax=Rutidosis leptorrhynchoides TaxID=125765 RepID=UPI003A99CCE9